MSIDILVDLNKLNRSYTVHDHRRRSKKFPDHTILTFQTKRRFLVSKSISRLLRVRVMSLSCRLVWAFCYNYTKTLDTFL